MVDKAALLDALAQGGTRAATQYQQTQQALQAQQQSAIQGALAQAAQSNAPQGAAQQLAAIQNSGTDARLAQSRANAAASAKWFDANRQASDSYLSTQGMLEKQFADQWLKDHAPSGGGGGGGGGGGDGGSALDEMMTPADILKQIRADAGLTGTGLSLAKYGKQYLSRVSRDDPTYQDLPRDLRARQYTQDYYGLPPELLDAVAPIGGFYEKMMKEMSQARNGTLIVKDPSGQKVNINTPQGFIKYMKYQAQQAPGNQSKAVRYIRGQIGQPAPAKAPKKRIGLW